jgi:hypothetical protein
MNIKNKKNNLNFFWIIKFYSYLWVSLKEKNSFYGKYSIP